MCSANEIYGGYTPDAVTSTMRPYPFSPLPLSSLQTFETTASPAQVQRLVARLSLQAAAEFYFLPAAARRMKRRARQTGRRGRHSCYVDFVPCSVVTDDGYGTSDSEAERGRESHAEWISLDIGECGAEPPGFLASLLRGLVQSLKPVLAWMRDVQALVCNAGVQAKDANLQLWLAPLHRAGRELQVRGGD
jgi:hypothetical protein